MSYSAETRLLGVVGGQLPQPDWTMSDNGRLLLEGTAKIWFEAGSSGVAPDNLPKMGDRHPYDARLQAHSSDITISRNGIGYCEAKYIGIKSGSITDPEWTLSGSTSDVSIKFHPNFEKFCNDAGWSSYVKNPDNSKKTTTDKIVFNSDGTFKAFGPLHPTVPAIETFTTSSGSLKMTYYCNNFSGWTKYSIGGLNKWTYQPPYVPSFFNVAGIGFPTPAPAGTPPKGMSWLLTGTSVTPYGNIYKVELDFTLSTLERPFNKYIYSQLS